MKGKESKDICQYIISYKELMGVIRTTFYSKVLREQTNVVIILPTYMPWRDGSYEVEYYANYGRKKTFYILHGGSDDCSLYLRKTKIEDYADKGDFAVVMPEVKNSFYCNMVAGKDYFTYLSEELPQYLERIYPIANHAEDRFVIGNSMGSHGAFKWALNRPDFFCAAAGMSGVGDVEEMGFLNRNQQYVKNAFGTSEQYRGSSNDLKHLALKLVDSGEIIPYFYSCCGMKDQFYEGTKEFYEYAMKIGFPLEYESGPGKHDWAFWDAWLPKIIKKMRKEGLQDVV